MLLNIREQSDWLVDININIDWCLSVGGSPVEMAHLSLLSSCELNILPPNVPVFPQDGACTDARQAQRPRGHARRDGAHPHSHPGRRTTRPCAVETETFKVIQCKTAK